MDPLELVPSVFGEPLAWAAWIGVGAVSAQWPQGWRRSALLAAAGLGAASIGAAGFSVALLLCVLIWAASLARLGAFAGVMTRGRWSRAAAGAAAAAVFVAADLGSMRLTGMVGALLDAVAPSVALGEALDGSVSWGGLATLMMPGVIGWAGAGLMAARSQGAPVANSWATALLAPGVVLLFGAASEPLPALWDGTTSGTANLHPSTVVALHRLERPLLFTVLQQEPSGIHARAARRRFERLGSGLTRASRLPVSVERLDLAETQEYMVERGLAPQQVGPHALAIRALDRDVVIPLVSTRGLQASLATALWVLHADEAPAPVLVVGEPWPSLEFGRAILTRPVADGEPPPEGTEAIVVLPSQAGLSPAGLAMLDAHVMGGGGLVVLYGEPLPDGPRRGVPLTNPWGFHAQGVGTPGRATATGDWSASGFDGLVVPPDAPPISGPDGLGEPVAAVGGTPVAMAMIGSVPSGFPGGPRSQSDGAVRAFLTSAAVARENPWLVARAVDWVLDEAELSPLREGPPARPERPRPLLFALGLLGPGLVFAGGLGQRET